MTETTGLAGRRPAGPPGLHDLREQVQACCGFDPGLLTPEARLDRLGLSGLAYLRLVVGLEATYQVDLPADLIGAIATVDDLVWFVAVKLSQRPELNRIDRIDGAAGVAHTEVQP